MNRLQLRRPAMGKDKWTPGFFNRMRQTGDRLADQTIQVLFQEHGVDAVSHVLEGLIVNDQPLPAKPPRLSSRADKAWRDYFTHSASLPNWARPALIEKGEQVYMAHGMMGFSILGCASLPEAYATDYAAKVLGITQQLERHVRRRIYETTQFVIDVMSGGGLKPRGKGIRAAQKVRLMHAAIRHLIRTAPRAPAADAPPRTFSEALLRSRWPKKYGMPIHQVAMSMAVLSFSYIVLRSLRKLGVGLSSEEETAYLHCWNVVGYVMGVDPDLLLSRPESMEQAQRLYELVWPSSIAQTSEGKLLEKTLLNYLEGFIPITAFFLRPVPRMLTRELLDETTADLLGVKLCWVERVLLWPLLKMQHDLYHLEQKAVEDMPLPRLAAEWFFRQMAKGLLGLERGDGRPPFNIPTHLARRKWRLNR
jgi:hypothetical protein